MKKILHLFSDPSHSALWSRYLRMLTLIALLAFGSHGVWGLGIKRNVSMTNVNVLQGKFEKNVYTWTSYSNNNLIQFKDLDNSDLSDYEKIVVPVSNWSSGVLRCVIKVKNDDNSTTDYTWSLYSTNSSSTPALKELQLVGGSFKNGGVAITKDQLKNVESVSFGGGSESGSATIGQIYLTKQLDWDENGQITILPQDINCDDRVTKNGTNFKFAGQFATVTIDFIGDGISAKKLASASSSENNSGFNIFYSIDDDYNNDKSSTSDLDESNVIRVKYAYQKEQPVNVDVTIDKFVLEYKDPITVTLNADPGTIDGKSSKTIKYCETPITLPAATPNDQAKVFNAWRYNDAHVGNAGDKYTPTENITLTAHYTNKTLYYNNELGNCLGDYTKTVPTNTVFTDKYTINKDTQKEFTFKCNRPQSEALNAFWYGWILWAKPSSATGNVSSNPFYFWTNAQDTRYATDASTGIWDQSEGSYLKISKEGKLYDMTATERNTYLSDMGNSAQVTVKVAYFDNTIRMYAVIKSGDDKRTYVQAYTYDKSSYIKDANSIDVYFSVDHAYLTNFTGKTDVNLVTATGYVQSGNTGTGSVKIYTTEGYDIKNPAKVGKGDEVVFEAVPEYGSEFSKWTSESTENPRTLQMDNDGGPWAVFVKSNGVKKTIMVDKNTREYYVYVPSKANVNTKESIPVIFSLHGRYNYADPSKDGKPNFNDIADANGIIVVYPQGRSGADKDKYTGYKDNWYDGFADCTGWEATGKENGDTRFIEELVAKIKREYPQADPKRFYLCGFSMGGMMTYAIATALNDKQLFAAYAATGGFPVNQFHLNLATTMPVPFYHVHGKADGYVKYDRLPEIRNNMLARYGCSLTPVNTVKDASYEHYTYRPIGKNSEDRTFADLEYVEVNGLDHSVHLQTPQGMWDFFKNYTTDIFNDYSNATTPEWQWDMEEINKILDGENHNNEGEGHRVYGWSHYTNNTANQKLPKRYLSYGEDKSTFVAEENNGDKKDGNGNVYPAVQLKKGKHVLHVKADVAKNSSNEGYVSIKIINNSTGVEIVARKLVNNSGTSSAPMTMVYSFETFDDAEFTIINSRSHDTGTKCTQLAIYREGYTTPDKDMSQDDFNTDITTGKVIEITFDNPDNTAPTPTLLAKYAEASPTSTTGADKTNQSGDYAFYYANRLNHKENNENQKVIKNDDAVFGNYFQNMPHADVFERTAAQDYMRIVIPDSKITELYNGVKASGQITIGFWVNAKLAVDRKLAYKDQSIFYLAGDTYGGPNSDDSKHLFGIKGDGSITGWMSNDVKYNTGGAFGAFCETSEDNRSRFYKNNFYLDGNWHYITFQMYDNLTRYNMYVDAFPAHKGGYATISNLEELKNLHSIVLGGLNANNVTYAYDVPFAYDDIVIYSRMLSHGDIKEIVAEKKYTPSWNFKQNLGNKNVFDASKLDSEWWTQNGNVYTLNKKLSTSANLTYNGIEVIPAFRGLQFATTDQSGQIKINATDGTLYLASGVTIGFTNIPEGNSLRFETANQFGTKENGCTRTGNLKEIDNHIRTSFKNTGSTGNISLTLGEMTTSWHDTYSGEVTIYSIERTNKSFMDLYYVDSNGRTTTYEYNGNGSETPDDLPSLKIIEDGTEMANNLYTITYSSSAPQVAYVNGQGTVTITGVPGSAVITAELKNDGKYDTTYRDTNNPYTLFEDETRIFTTYEIVTKPSMNYQKQSVGPKGTPYIVDQKLTTDDKSVMVTLGGWRYGGTDTRDGAIDTYNEVTEWEGFNCRNYTANSNFGVFEELFDKPLSTNGSRASRNEMWSESDNGEYKPTENNTITNNKTPWTLPCRGSHIKVEPIKPGIVSVYVMQEGCVTRDTNGEPDAVSLNSVYITDETGKSIREVACETKTRIADQIWNNDGRPRAEYNWYDEDKAYNKAIYESFKKISVDGNYAWSFLDNWENPGMKQHVFCLDFYNSNDGMGTDGHAIITKGVVRYTFNVLPGKTYYIFSNNTLIGLAGFSFYEGKHINFTKVQERKYSFWRADATNPLKDVTLASKTIDDQQGISQFTNFKNATIIYNRSFTANKWAGICLPYSISNRQMREQFGEATKVILLNKTYPNKYGDEIVQFIWHPNQDIIAGYPYLILPSASTGSITTNSHVSATTPAFFVNDDMTTTDYDANLLQSGLYGSNKGYSFGSNKGYVFAGNFETIGVPEHSYVISNGKLAPAAANLTLKPFRAYLHNTSGAKAKKLKSMSVSRWDDLDDESGTTTSIDELLEESGIFTGGANVYDLNGVLVRKNTHTLQGLPKGIYIVNGKKHVVK